MKKIIIIGSSGAGKTTLAKDLSTILVIPHFELDSFYHQKNWQPLANDKFQARVNTITKEPEWIVCGNYFSKLGGIDFWRKADTVIWCDYSFPLVFSRLFRRTLHRTITRQELWNGNKEGFITNFFSNDSVILWMVHEWNKYKQRYGTLFASNDIKGVELVRLKSPKATKTYMKKITELRKK